MSSALAAVQSHAQQPVTLPKAEPATCQKVAHYVRNFFLLLWDLPKVLLQSRAHIFHNACENNHLWTVMLFTKCGFKGTTSFEGKFPLVTAAIKGHEQVVAHLAARDPKVTWKFYDSFPEGALALLPYVQAKDLPPTAKRDLMSRLVEEAPLDRALAKALVGRGFSLVPALEALIEKEKRIPDLEALLDLYKETGGDINALAPLLHTAADHSPDEVVSYLISRKDLDVNQRERRSQSTFLMDLCWEDRLPLVARLLQTREDVDLNAVDKHGRTALEIAAFEGHRILVEFLLTKLKKEDAEKQLPAAFLSACKRGFVDVARDLLTRDPSLLTAKDKEGKTALMHASREGPEMADLLLAKQKEDGTQELLDAQDKDGCTALMIAAQNKRDDLVHKLLEAGASPRITNRRKQNFLMQAAKSGYGVTELKKLMQYCEKHCPEIFPQKDAEEQTVVHHALLVARNPAMFLEFRHCFDASTRDDIVRFVVQNPRKFTFFIATVKTLISIGFGVTDEGKLSPALEVLPKLPEIVAEDLNTWKTRRKDESKQEGAHA